jgi:uncharacterized protein (TIGR02302 family)
MTRSLLSTELRPGWADRVRRHVFLARVILAFERIWPALWPATGIVGVGIAAALLDAFAPLPWPLHALILACFVTAISLTLYFNLQHTAWPRWQEGARRLERDSDLQHRPISEADDALAAGAGDPEAEELWRAHLAARLGRLDRLHLNRPRSDLARRDPKALRFGVLVLIAFALFMARGDWARRLEGAFSPNAGALATLDAWIDPPAYTGEAPVYLGRAARLSVPTGSVLHLRVHGADHRPSITLDDVRFSGNEGEYAGEATLTEDGRIRVRAGGHTIGSWKIAIIPDHAPFIAFAEKPAATERQSLKLSYKAGDDYGVTSARAIIRPHGRQGAPLTIDLQLPDRSAKTAALTTFRDLTENPYAGLDVDITLQAMDAAGNTATSNTLTIKLPQRIFTDPLARALIEQRQNLASIGPSARQRAARTLDALTLAPEYFYVGKTGVYLAIRSAFRSVQNAESAADDRRIQDILWQTAMGLEQGGLLTMAEQLRRLQQLLTQAMAQGAPQSDIDALLKRYNELMQQYLTALAQNAPQEGGPSDPNAKVLGAGDLDALMKAIQELSQSGDRLRAMQLLAMLQSLLENVQVAGGKGGAGGDAASNEALRGLSDLMGKQRMLLDKTFRQSDGNGDPKDGGGKGLSLQQGQLKGDLGTLQKKFPGKKSPGQDNLDKAGKLMDEAQQALNLSDFGRASTLQKYVLDELRKGADAVAKAAGQGQGKGQAQGQDPLGRTAGAQGRGGSDVRIPDASVLQRARDILLELRRRAGQQGRPKEELDYIDRLLKQF